MADSNISPASSYFERLVSRLTMEAMDTNFSAKKNNLAKNRYSYGRLMAFANMLKDMGHKVIIKHENDSNDLVWVTEVVINSKEIRLPVRKDLR